MTGMVGKLRVTALGFLRARLSATTTRPGANGKAVEDATALRDRGKDDEDGHGSPVR
jgi:hypothetical protein